LLLGGAGYFLGLYPTPAGATPLAAQLMTAFVHSGLLDIAMAIEALAGLLILAGIFVPVALAAVLPISICGLYWTLILNQQPAGALLALVAFALNGLLMLAYLESYRGVLQRRALAAGEA
jgi:hypothetical protein